MYRNRNRFATAAAVFAALGMTMSGPSFAQLTLAQSPLFLTEGRAPLVLLTMSRDHKLFYEAYNDYSDLDGDGTLDVGYKPDSVDYYGYFDSYKCYAYSGGRFSPSGTTLSITAGGVTTQTKKCSGKWSGDFLNYVTMSRMDALRKVLYGGYRSTDTTQLTVLERSFIPQDAHSWGKEYFSVARDGYDISDYTPFSLPTSGRYHIFANTTLTSDGSPPLMRVLTNTTYRVWEWLSIERPVAGSDCATGNNVRASCTTANGSSMADYTVRVEVCSQTGGIESNCKTYGTSRKPVGLLQRQGENGGMYFGLLTGSYANNTQGGVLRKAIASINNEITADGRFGGTGETCASGANCVNGIISTINKLKIVGFNYANKDYSCGWITTTQMINGQCNAWGNPIGEMLYEGLRYFNGKTTPTSTFSYSGTTIDGTLGLPQLTSWSSPYAAGTPNMTASPPTFASCAKPYAMLISDVYPSFDSDSVPGSAFSSFAGDLTGLNVNTIGGTIWNQELGNDAKNIFIGQSGNTSDGTPTAKAASSFGNIRGLTPGEPTREGSYSSAAAAYFGHTTDLSTASGDQKLNTYSVALAAPLPKLEIPVNGKTVTILPLAKSVSGSSISAAAGAFQPTNQIVDFYVEKIRNVPGSPTDNAVNGGRPSYEFRINYEDVEQGADHDMDAIALYEIKLNADDTVSVKVNSNYAAGGITQHMGFAISGTTQDGAYLIVRDSDTGANTDDDIAYALDCHLSTNDTNPANCSSLTAAALPLEKELKFTASSTDSATLLKDPLWYAAKWGGFVDSNANDLPDSGGEWDSDNDGVPDNYFMVTNPLNLETQLTKAFAKIKNETATAAATAANSFSYQINSTLYQARLSSDGWGGELNAYPISFGGNIGSPTWRAHYELADISAANREILTYDPDAITKGIAFDWDSMTSTGTPYLRSSLNRTYNGTTDGLGQDRVSFLRGDVVANMRTRPYISGTNTVNKLGDIVNSQPQYVAIPNFGYGETSYASFRNENKTRAPMLYVGANDGMLHVFSAEDGEEKLAYIPSEMYRVRGGQPLLSKLTASNYGQSANAHHYYVDGSPRVGDICTVTCADKTDWKTILVGGLNAGGQGIYALNITNPADFNEASASSIVMWEFNDRQDTDLGYTFSRPSIAKLCTKLTAGECSEEKWVVIFGNGYNNTEADGYASTTGHAVLYVVNALTGVLIKKIDTEAGSTAAPNGLSTPAVVDENSDGYVDYVYAGDLLGNMWKFDLTSDNSAAWDVAYGTNNNPKPLYTAVHDGSVQAITSTPEVTRHPDGGLMVVFGTGSYMSSADKGDTAQNTLYGIRDQGAVINTNNLSNLQQQTVYTVAATYDTTEYRTVSTNNVGSDKDGWYLHLPDPGERIVYEPRVISSVLAVTTTVPNEDVCGYGGWSWTYYINPLTGGRLSWSVFADVPSLDFDADVSGYAAASKSSVGITPGGTTVYGQKGQGDVYNSGTSGSSNNGINASAVDFHTGRLSWREVIRN